MCRLLETVKITGGIPHNIRSHNARLNRTRRELFGSKDTVDLGEYIDPPGRVRDAAGVFKCRIVYSRYIEKIEYIPYVPRTITSLKLVRSDTIEYPYKFEDRRELEQLFRLRGTTDDILIVKKGKVTDTSFSNIAFFDGRQWMTPDSPLLPGTKRALLLERGEITEARILPEDIPRFSRAVLLNSMLDIGDTEGVDVRNIR